MENNDNLKNYHVESGSVDNDYQSINKKNNKKIFIIIFIVLLVLVGLLLVIFNRDKIFNKKQSAPVVTQEQEEEEEIFKPDLNDENFDKYYKIPDEYANDKDRDGLSAEEEEKLGTSDLKYDTDEDGLPDKIEIEKWGTDPTNKDTDGDGYTDAFEIFKGYNPNGEGKL
jgi:hypothetical protein